jgi:multidrug efflux pump subunit AcrA (membrane-fusion protein)
MHGKIRRILPIIVILILAGAGVAAWYTFSRSTTKDGGGITASGTVEAVEVIVSPEISGRASEVLVAQGDAVLAGQPLLKLDGTLLQAQHKLVEAGIISAKAGLDTARAALQTAQRQYQQILETARLADAPARAGAWGSSQPSEFDLPDWYFSKQEQIAAMQAEVEAARQTLDKEQQALQTLLADPAYAGLLAAEQRVTKARAAFLTARDVLQQANASGAGAELRDAAQTQYDSAQQELEDAQKAYAGLLTTDQGEELLKARGRVRAAEARYSDALDRLARLHTGEDSDAVQIAAAVMHQAEAAVAQAETAVAQAEAQLDSIDAQIGKLTVFAPVAGTVLVRNIEPGEMVLAGSTALVLGELDKLTITVYVPENRYGEIRLGQKVQFTVDSFPGKIFTGSVSRIADQAEFTPRNVQTAEGRSTTVFAVGITVDNPSADLKPGMPADVTFGQ